MKHEIEIGFQAYLADGAEEFGAVRQVLPNGDVVIYVENGGDFLVTAAAIHAVHSGKVVVDPAKLEQKLVDAIAHSHDAEEPGK